MSRDRSAPARGRKPETRPAPRASEPALAPAEPGTWWVSAALGATFLAVYLAMAPPVSGDKDASEFALALATGGVTHPTGYPLFTLLGHFFVGLLHRFGATFPFAANAWAALGGAVALTLYHRVALRLLPLPGLARAARILLTALPVILLGFNPVWTLECTVVEVHSWQMAWLAGLLLAFAGLVERLEQRGSPDTRLGWRLAGWGFLCGLGGAHHTTAVYFAGGLTLALIVALARARRLDARVPLLFVGAGLLPLASYAYIYVKALHPGAAELWPKLQPTLASVIDHITAQEYRKYLGHWAPNVQQAAWFAGYVGPYLAAGLLLLALHLIQARSVARRLIAGGLLLSALAQALFTFRYGVGDPDAYFMPPLAVAFLAMAQAAGALLSRWGSRGAQAAAGVVIVLALAVYAAADLGLLRERRRVMIETDRSLRALWQSIPYSKAIVLWPSDTSYRLREYQVFLGEKPGIDVYNTASLFFPHPRAAFQQKYGFDPMAVIDEEHRRQPLKPEYAVGQQPTETMRHAYAVMHEWIAQSAPVPVLGVDPPNLRDWTPKAGTAAPER